MKLKKIDILNLNTKNLNYYTEELLKNDKKNIDKLNDILEFFKEYSDEDFSSLLQILKITNEMISFSENTSNDNYNNIIKFMEENKCSLTKDEKFFMSEDKDTVISHITGETNIKTHSILENSDDKNTENSDEKNKENITIKNYEEDNFISEENKDCKVLVGTYNFKE